MYASNEGADTDNSKINYFTGTMLDSQIVLGNDNTSSITYEISVYNNSDCDQLFIGVITDKLDNTLYSNLDIDFSVTLLEEYVTVLASKKSMTFEISFSYKEGIEVTDTILDSKLNFRFKEIPKLILSNDEKNYTLDNIYPGGTFEYEFTVSNYDDNSVNKVPMTYSFESSVDSPFSIKVFDESGNEVVGEIDLAGDGENKIIQSYLVKISWDVEDFVDYSDYEGREYVGSVILRAVAKDSKYLDYRIEKKFNFDISASSFYFIYDIDDSINMEKSGAILPISINNYISDSEYNNYDIEYDISIYGNDKFNFVIDDEESVNGVISRKLVGNKKLTDSFDLIFKGDINLLNVSENVILKLNVKSPYVKEINIPITIKLQEVLVTLNANGGSVIPSTITVYKGMTYSELPTPSWLGHTFNGWYSSKSGGTKYENTMEVTTSSSTQTLYARWTSYLLADLVSVGDYVDYPVYYSNVPTSSSGTYYPKDTYTGWRVVSIEGSGDDSYVKLVSAGIPLTYVHPATSSSGTTSVKALTTNFFSTAISSTSTNYKFRRCGLKKSSTATTTLSSISAVQDLFENVYTQVSSAGVPLVQSMTKSDLDSVWGSTTANGTYLTTNDLLAIPSKDVSGQYAAYYLADYNLYNSSYYLWNVRYLGAIVFTNGEHGIRPVVKLKTNVIKTGGSGTRTNPYTIDVE